jgi:hypothetical protein
MPAERGPCHPIKSSTVRGNGIGEGQRRSGTAWRIAEDTVGQSAGERLVNPPEKGMSEIEVRRLLERIGQLQGRPADVPVEFDCQAHLRTALDQERGQMAVTLPCSAR